MKVMSYFSMKYGVYAPEILVQWALDSGYSTLFLAEINNTGSALSFVRSAQRKGLHPVLGVELRNGMQIQATIMARNNRGFHEMNRYITPFIHDNKPFPSVLPHFSNCWVFYPINNALTRPLLSHEFYQIDLRQLANWEIRYASKFERNKVVLLSPMLFKIGRAHV